MLKKLAAGALVVLVLFAFSLFSQGSSTTVSAAAGINHQINFQGKLVNPSGTNVTDGSYSIVFSLYSVSSAGSAIWTETQSPTITNGIFQVNLGSVTALPGSVDFNTDNLYLGIKVGADAEMTPRIQFTSVPQAFNSEKLGGIDKTGFIQNQTASTQTADFKISGTGTLGTSLTTPLVQNAGNLTMAATGANSLLFQTNGSTRLTIDSSGNATLTGTLTVQGAGLSTINGSLSVGGNVTMAGGTIRPIFNGIIGGTAGWYKLGTVSLAQSGATAIIKLYGGSGYNATPNQDGSAELMIRASNSSSTGPTGFGASAVLTRYGQTSSFASDVKLVSNAAGAAATSYDVYVYNGTFIGNGFYTVDLSNAGGGWAASVSTAADPGVNSTTVFDVPQEFRVLNTLNVLGNNVGIGTSAAPGYRLDVQGGDINTSANIRTAGTIRIDSTGNLTNIGTITSGLINGQTVSSAANFTGTLAVAGTSTLATINSSGTINFSSAADGLMHFYGGASDGTANIYSEVSGTQKFRVNRNGSINATSLSLRGAGDVINSPTTFGVDNSGNVSAAGTMQGTQHISTVATGTAPLTVASTTMVANLNSQYLNGYSETQLAENLRANVNITGGGTVTYNGGLAWTSRFIVIANGNGSDFSTSGFFDINIPANATVITGVGGHANATVASGAVPMSGWDALYYILPIGSANTSLNANFRIATYTAGMQVPSNWVLLAVVNGDNNTMRLGTGITLRSGQSATSGAWDNAQFNSSTTTPLLQNAGNLTMAATGANSLLFQTNGSTRLTVDSSGNGTLTGNLIVQGTGTSTFAGALRAAGELQSTSANALRMVQGNYGSIFRNDGSDTYLLLTASADQYGSWNGLRPLQVSNATGTVYLGGQQLTVLNGGNIGINNTNPTAAKLDIAGNVNIKGDSATALVVQNSASVPVLEANTLAKTVKLTNGTSVSSVDASTSNSIINWRPTTSLPEGVDYPGGATYNGRQYILGGYNGSVIGTVRFSTFNTDGTMGSWTSTTALPAVREYASATAYNGYIYELGGYDGTAYTSTVYVAPINGDGTVGAWSTTTAIPQTLGYSSAQAYNGYMYLFGGYNGSDTATVYVAPINANGTLGAWTTTTALPVILDSASTVVANGYVYVIGGTNASELSSVYYAAINANGTLGAWTTGAALPEARELGAAEYYKNTIYFVGGLYSGSSYRTVYSTVVGGGGSISAWTDEMHLPLYLQDHVGAINNGYVYILGGWDTANNSAAVLFASLANRQTTNISSPAQLTVSSTGIGIGVASASALLDVNGNMHVGGNNTIDGVLKVTGTGSSTFTGRLGIGVANPNSMLQVADLINFDGPMKSTSLGLHAGFNNAGYYNSFIGHEAGNFNTTGQSNTGIGQQALNNNVTSNNNTAVGDSALRRTVSGNNTAIGASSLQASTTGTDNTAAGYRSLYNNTTGSFNTALGDSSMATNTTGGSNTAIGFNALFTNNGNANVAVGGGALQYNTTGTSNSGLGVNSLNHITTGIQNAVLGTEALSANTTGSNNIALGYQAGITNVAANANTTGSNNTFLGFNSGPGSTTQLQNATAIGANAVVSQSNAIVLGSINGVNGATSSTNVGIGTIVPAARLQVNSGDLYISGSSHDPSVGTDFNSFNNGLALVQSTGFNGNYSALITGVANGTWGGDIQLITRPAAGGAATEKLRVTAGGNVGIGTVSPSALLNVNYNSGTYDSATRRYVDITGDYNGTNPATVSNAGAFTGLRLGYIGNGKYATLGAVSEDSLGYSRITGLSFSTSDVDAAATERVRITGTGNVGIGKTNPGAPLSLGTRGTGRTLYTYEGNGDNTVRGFGNDLAGVTGGYEFSIYSPQAANAAYGGVSIGKMSIDGAYTYTPNLYVRNNGSVCVGSLACVNKLGVSGNIGASGSITASTTPDVAETIPAAPGVEAADVVMADPDNTERVIKTTGAYSGAAVGVISDGTSSFMINAHANKDGAPLTGAPLVLAGRVPVKITNEGGPVTPGDYLTSSSTPGYAMKATHAGPTIGKALGFFDGTQSTGTVLALINVSYYNPNPSADIQANNATFNSMTISGGASMGSLNVGGLATLGSLQVMGSADIANNLHIGGDLTVVGNAHIGGNLDVGGDLTVKGLATVMDITVGGHVITAGSQPTPAALAALGTDATVVVSGNDTSGTITITTGQQAGTPLSGSDPTVGELAAISFAKQYGASVQVSLTPMNSAAADMHYYVAGDQTKFTLSSTTQPAKHQVYVFSYFVRQ